MNSVYPIFQQWRLKTYSNMLPITVHNILLAQQIFQPIFLQVFSSLLKHMFLSQVQQRVMLRRRWHASSSQGRPSITGLLQASALPRRLRSSFPPVAHLLPIGGPLPTHLDRARLLVVLWHIPLGRDKLTNPLEFFDGIRKMMPCGFHMSYTARMNLGAMFQVALMQLVHNIDSIIRCYLKKKIGSVF